MNHWVNIAIAGLLTVGHLTAEPSSPADVRGRTPKNVLRAHLGVTGGTGPSCPLLKDDPTVPLRLQDGDFTVHFNLNDLHIVSELAFVNENTRGTVKCFVSTDQEAWVEVVAAHLIPGARASRVRFVGSEARFVRLEFSVTEPGNLYSLGLFGLTVAADYNFKEILRAEDVADVDATPLIEEIREPLSEEFDEISLTITPSDARVPWISSLSEPNPAEVEALQLIDENSFTTCEFAADDPSPSVLLDLQSLPVIERVGVLYAKQPGVLRLRLLQTADQRLGTTPESSSDDHSTESVEEFIFEDVKGIGKFAFNRLATKSRYIELSWKPDVQAESTDSPDPAATTPAAPFSINEVAVFSRGNRKYLEQSPLRRIASNRVDTTVVQSLQTTPAEPNIPDSLTEATPAALAAAADAPAEPAAPDLELDPTSF
ncbi:MAG: hypothetical protein R3F19_04175 [Verrucomicrobiales bacterium]